MQVRSASYTILRLPQPERLVAAIQQAVIVCGRFPTLILCHPDELPHLQAVMDREVRSRPAALPALAVPEHASIQPGTVWLA